MPFSKRTAAPPELRGEGAPRSPAAPAMHEALDSSTIAGLSATTIERMTRRELIRVIRAARVPDRLCPKSGHCLAFYDLKTLRRLAYVARRCCQSQLR